MSSPLTGILIGTDPTDGRKLIYYAWRPKLRDYYDDDKEWGRPFPASYGRLEPGNLVTNFITLSLDDKAAFSSFVMTFGLEPFVKYLGELQEFMDIYVDKSARDKAVMPPNRFERIRRYLCDSPRTEIAADQAYLQSLVAKWFDDTAPLARLLPKQRFWLLPDDDFAQNVARGHLAVVPPVLISKEKRIAAPSDVADLSVEELVLLFKENQLVDWTMLWVPDIVAACCVEILAMLENGRTVGKCDFCGLYFVPTRPNEKYCRRPQRTKLPRRARGDTVLLTCQDLGPQKAYSRSLKNSPLKLTYRRAYKRNHNLCRQGKLNRENFVRWTDDARAKLREAESGTLSPQAFDKWTRQEVLPFNRPSEN